MGFRPVAIIVAVVMQIDFENLVHLLQQREGFVNRCVTHGWELALDFCVQLARAGMSVTDRNQPHQLDSLGGQPEITRLQCGNQLVKPDTWIGHEISFEN